MIQKWKHFVTEEQYYSDYKVHQVALEELVLL
jgi:hypothetical protein